MENEKKMLIRVRVERVGNIRKSKRIQPKKYKILHHTNIRL